jgi:hypothetical protein
LTGALVVGAGGRGVVVVVVVVDRAAEVVLAALVLDGAALVGKGTGSATGSGDRVSAQNTMPRQNSPSTTAVMITVRVWRRVMAGTAW